MMDEHPGGGGNVAPAHLGGSPIPGLELPSGIEARYCTSNSSNESLLTRAEREAAGAFGDARRASFTLGRTLLRATAAHVLGCAPEDVPLAELTSGALALPGTGWQVNLTHTRDAAGVVLARRRVGIDAEYVRPRNPALWTRILSPGEGRPNVPGWSEEAQLILAWAAKEAALKASGVGLRLGASAARLSQGFSKPVFEAETPEGSFRVVAVRHDGAVWAVAWEA